MAATSTVAPGRTVSTSLSTTEQPITWRRRTWHGILLLLTAVMLLIHGYHPFSEDGGVYLAGIEYRLDPSLFPHFTAFVTAHLHYSLFSNGIAALVRITHMPLAWALLAAYVCCLWLTLYAALRVLECCALHPVAQFAGVALFAAWATLPVAGTSLVLIDPYLTARSLSTPLSLLAIGFALDTWPKVGFATLDGLEEPSLRSLIACLLCLLLAVAVHPLMAACAIAMVAALRAVRSPSWTGKSTLLAATAILVASVMRVLAPQESPAVVLASLSRYYWFLSQWRWYELCGLAGPLIILLLLLRWKSRHASPCVRDLCLACVSVGCIAILIALLFAHRDAPSHLLARLQPLRVFLLIYALMTLLLAATLTQRLLLTRCSQRICWLVLTTVFLFNAAVLFLAQRDLYAASQHLETPWRPPINPWSQAFIWVRDNTPKDAIFALDADYITQPGEDAQTFRSTAQRSALPDFSKDGGEASITPALAQLWQQGSTAQTNLSLLEDADRDARLRPLGVTWFVLHSAAATQHDCPYSNSTVKVCRLSR